MVHPLFLGPNLRIGSSMLSSHHAWAPARPYLLSSTVLRSTPITSWQETCYTHSLIPQLVSCTLNENSDHLIDNHSSLKHGHISSSYFSKCFGTWWHYIISLKNRNSKLFKILRRRYILLASAHQLSCSYASSNYIFGIHALNYIIGYLISI